MTDQTVIRGGCIRFDTDAPRLHVNPTHRSVGLVPETLTILDNGLLYVGFDEPLTVVAAIAAADETLTGRGISAGISGGVTGANIRFYLAGHGPLYLDLPLHYDKLRGATSNLWIQIVSLRPVP